MTQQLIESSTDSEGICADLSSYRNPSSSSGRGSMTSSMANDRMFLSTMSTPRRPPSRIPALMTKSLHAPRSSSTPGGPSTYGSGEQLCQDYGSFGAFEFRRIETENLLTRSQERRQQRASSYDPRCLLSLHATSTFRLSTSATVSSNPHLMTSSSHPSYSRLLPKRPQWIRSQPTVILAESTVSMELSRQRDKFYLDSDEDSEEEEDLDEEQMNPRRMKKHSIRRMKEKNRKKYRNSLRRLHHHSAPSTTVPLQYPYSDFLCVSSPLFYFLIAFLFRIFLFFTETLFSS